MPGGVPAAAMPEAGNMSDEELMGAEKVAVWASARRFGHPLAVYGSDELPLVHPRTIVPTNDSRPATPGRMTRTAPRAVYRSGTRGCRRTVASVR